MQLLVFACVHSNLFFPKRMGLRIVVYLKVSYYL